MELGFQNLSYAAQTDMQGSSPCVPSLAFMSGVSPEALCLLVPEWVGRGPAGIPVGVVIHDSAHLNAWPTALDTLGWREPGLSKMWCNWMGDREQQLAPVGRPRWRMGMSEGHTMCREGGTCTGRVFGWGFEGCVGVCQVGTGRWGAVGGIHKANGGGAHRYYFPVRAGRLVSCSSVFLQLGESWGRAGRAAQLGGRDHLGALDDHSSPPGSNP